MPYLSVAQQRWAHTDDAKRKNFPTEEFDRASEGQVLPARRSRKRKTPLEEAILSKRNS